MIYDISILAANTANNITIKNVLEQVVKIPEKYLPNTYFINLTVEQRESLNEGNTIYVDVDYDIYNCVEVVFFDQQPVYLKRYKTLQYFYGFGVNSRTNPGPYYYYYLAPASSNSQFKLQRSTINIPTATSELTNDAGFITQENTNEYTPTGDYNPATKKYVDDAAGAKVDKVEGKQLSTNDYTNEDKEKLNSLENYTLPAASADTLGGIKIGTNLTIAEDGTLSAQTGSIGKPGTGANSEIFNNYTRNTASGEYSHAEGDGAIASGYAAHAEGCDAEATGDISHAEGNSTVASGVYSHAEGAGTTSEGRFSHAEGYCTVAHGVSQHVQGEYNIIDTQGDGNWSLGKYAHIVGNGNSDTERSNAHTIDWNGLGWFKGGLKIGGMGQDDTEAKEIATKEYVDDSIANIAVSTSVYTHVSSATSTADLATELLPIVNNMYNDYLANKVTILSLICTSAELPRFTDIYNINTSNDNYFTLMSSSSRSSQKETPDNSYTKIQDYYRVIEGKLSSDNTSVETISFTLYGYAQNSQYLDVKTNYGAPYEPLYDGSPATKKYVDDNLAIQVITTDIAFVNGTKPSYTSGWYNFTGTITINGTDVSSNGYWDETSLIQIKDDGDRVYFYFIDPDDIEHKDYLSAYVYYDVEAGIWKPEENDSVYTKKVLTKENTNEYTPKTDYNPATKKYVDDAIAELKTYIDNAIANAVFAADATDHEPTTTTE